MKMIVYVVQRDDLAVDLRADAAVADVGVDLVGEVQRRGADRERLDLALGREDEDLVLDQLAAELVGELRRVLRVSLPIQQRLEPLELLVGRVHPAGAVLLVAPVRGESFLPDGVPAATRTASVTRSDQSRARPRAYPPIV